MDATLDAFTKFRALIMYEAWESWKAWIFNACFAAILIPSISFFSSEEHSLDEIAATALVPLIIAYLSGRLLGVLISWLTRKYSLQAHSDPKAQISKNLKFFAILAIVLVFVIGIIGTITTILSLPIYWWLGINWALQSGTKVFLAFVSMWAAPIAILLIVKASLDLYRMRDVWLGRALCFGDSLTTILPRVLRH